MKLLKIAAFLSSVALFSCQKEISGSVNTGKVSLVLTNVVKGQPLAFNRQYTTATGEDFTISKFKYYITNIVLIDSTGGLHPVPDSYFLTDQSKPETLTLGIADDVGSYRAVQFLLGVDSLRNVSGAQTDALDPLNDMFWTWNSGYIMAKMEGTSTLSNLPGQRIEYHIGGFSGPFNALRSIILPFPKIYSVTTGEQLTINVKTELENWFNGSHQLSIAQTPSCTTPGSLASQYADNYSTMFSISSIEQQ